MKTHCKIADPAFWTGKRVLVTGHTGFKGTWLSHWLVGAGAQVHGIALEPATEPDIFTRTGLGGMLAGHHIQDIADAQGLAARVRAIEPEIVIHMAAQALVRRSFRDPLETYRTNVMGTANLLESLRAMAGVRAIVNVTSDKCYDNTGQGRAFREDDPLGGSDPYSSSKACADLVGHSFQMSHFAGTHTTVASARAGNVVGGGDWAEDRLIPDVVRAMERGEPVQIRNPRATRPWQHVLEPLSGYLMLARSLYEEGAAYAGGWNFGPGPEGSLAVEDVLDRIGSLTGKVVWVPQPGQHPHEAQSLQLDIAKAATRLGWRPRWTIETCLRQTFAWYAACGEAADMAAVTRAQIDAYEASSLLET